MRRIILILLIGLICVSCISTQDISKPVPEIKDCDLSILSEREKGKPETLCFINAVATRCNTVDSCLLNCWSDRSGDGIGGGCHHLCWGYAPEDWEIPSDAKMCQE